MAQGTSYIRQFFEAIRDERGYYRNTATRIGTAFLLLLDYIAAIDYPYLRKDVDDTASGRITFLSGLTAHLQSLFEGLSFSDVLKSEGAASGFDGTGITMTAADGKIQADALEVRGWMRLAKMVYNMIQVFDQDYQFSGGGDIERVVDNQDGTYTLHIHKEKEGRHTSFSDFDILYGKVDEQPAAGNYEYWTSWMRVCENGVTLNEGMTPDTVRVELWDDEDVPGGRNFEPKAMMTVAKRGNTQVASRQSFWELSTTDQRITYYWRVDQPVLRADNYALCLGMLPQVLEDAGVLPSTRDRDMPSLFVNEIFYHAAHHVSYPSRLVKEDRGEWLQQPTAVYDGVEVSEPYHYRTFTTHTWQIYRNSSAWASLSDEELEEKMLGEFKVDLEVSRVWHFGCLWECRVDGTAQEPGFGNHWGLVSGTGWHLSFDFDSATVVMVGDVRLRAEALVLLGDSDQTARVVADGIMQSVAWTRDSGAAAEDAQWTPTVEQGSHGLALLIDHSRLAGRRTDCGSNWESLLRCRFLCAVTLQTGVRAEGEVTIA